MNRRTVIDFISVWQVMKIGCPNPRFFNRRSPRIIEIVGPLYLKGLSITDIYKQTGIPRSSIHASLRANRHVLRTQHAVPFDRWRKGHGKRPHSRGNR